MAGPLPFGVIADAGASASARSLGAEIDTIQWHFAFANGECDPEPYLPDVDDSRGELS